MATPPPPPPEQQRLVSAFIEVAAVDSNEVAVQYLQATSWKLDEAIQLFYSGGDGGSSSVRTDTSNAPVTVADNTLEGNGADEGGDNVRAPLPVKREILYGDAPAGIIRRSSMVPFRNFEEELKQSAVWDSGKKAESSSRDLASLYRPPYALMYNGSFEQAKSEATYQGKWLLVNIQSTDEFSSHMLNRDTWGQETVAETIHTNFIFWQVFHDTSEGKKVRTYYNLVSVPAILVIDPITGAKMKLWTGMVQPEQLLEDLLPYLDGSPTERRGIQPKKRPRKVTFEPSVTTPEKNATPKTDDEEAEIAMAIAASLEGIKGITDSQASDKSELEEATTDTVSDGKLEYPPLPDEPSSISKNLICRVGIRLPDGRRLTRNFLQTDQIKLLWSFCCGQVEEGSQRRFHFAQAIPGATKVLEYGESEQTFEEAGLSNSVVTLAWD